MSRSNAQFWTEAAQIGHDVNMDTASGHASRVLVVGDINPDLILRGDVVPRFGQSEQLLDEASLVIGGSAAITAHGLARLERPVSLVGAVGVDLYGEEICRRLVGAGVDISPVLRRTGQPTGLTVVLSGPDDRAILTLPGTIASLTATEMLAAAAALASDALASDALASDALGHVHISSLYLQPTLVASLPDALAELRGRGLTISLDTNDDPARQWEIDALLPHLDLLLPNRSEVMALGREPDPRLAAAGLARRGPLVVVKNGSDGAFAVAPDGETVGVPAVPVAAIDTTGAGDSFNAAFLDSWLDGLDLSSCLERAGYAGGRSVAAVGGTAGQPNRQELISEKGLNDR
ncbi:sugar/nucleoside kinase (ribokinase family) [Jatrophihabitans sp. GAS493]|uniref:carbohydrate kinase family protein n=1 Tax=Jatrophihabitans sp. GAS493 TaxID=1907575 RepID=UPI000BC00B93|nr:carbohydrate kinase family protein [Jatrophihabitans sp. GAS493]SOD74874.1 sugar/nucleoside kinase (ribokinase family) [Jatrophihabitans sp. GAS493]